MREKKYASDTRPIESGQKVSGIRRHIAVDTQSLPHAVQVTMVEVTDRKGALQATTDNRPVQGELGSGPNTVRLTRLNLIKSMTYGIFPVKNNA